MPSSSINVVVTELKADFDPFGGEYVQVTLAFKLPIPFKPPRPQTQYPPVRQPVVYKHAIHVFIPRDKWTGQYTMWQEFHLIIRDDGAVELKPVRQRSMGEKNLGENRFCAILLIKCRNQLINQIRQIDYALKLLCKQYGFVLSELEKEASGK